MRKSLLATLITVSLLTVFAIVATAATSRSAAGTWKLDVAKSSFRNMPAPKAEQLVVTTDEPTMLKWRLIGASPDGKTYTSSYDGPIDGKEHPLMSSEAGSMIAYARTADGGVKWTLKDKNGAVIETGSSRLSADGSTLTLRGTTQGASGKADFISVFARVE
jgi:hypothetical protein